jgi:hypothetical protein
MGIPKTTQLNNNKAFLFISRRGFLDKQKRQSLDNCPLVQALELGDI